MAEDAPLQSFILRLVDALPQHAGHLVSMVVLLLVVTLARAIARRRIADSAYPAETKRRLLVNVRNLTIVLFLAGVVVIWAPQFRAIAAGLLLFISAVVIATKELIMCLTGSLVRVFSGAFVVGDRIEVGNFRGDVIDVNFFSTTIMEVGPGQLSHQRTGRTITIPNSVFLSSGVINEAMANRYVLHPITVPLRKDEDWVRGEDVLQRIANEECASYLDEARQVFQAVARRHALDVPTVEPRVLLVMRTPDQVDLLLRMPVPARQKGRMQEAVLRRFLSEFRGAKGLAQPSN